MLSAELVKLRRSSVWLIAVFLPVAAVATGTLNLAANRDMLGADWQSYTSQVLLFYGLLFFSMGVGLLAAAAWRTEHRGTNIALLLTGTRPLHTLVLAKIAAIAVPVAFMQFVLVAAALLAGAFLLRLPGPPPWELALVGAVSVVAALPLIAVQSLLSLLLRSFAAPVGVCLLGCVAGVAVVTSEALRPLVFVVPQALVTRVLNTGSTALAGSGALTAGGIAPLLLAAVAGTALVAAATVGALKRIVLR